MKKCAYCDIKTKLTEKHIWPKCLITRMPKLEFRYIGSQDFTTYPLQFLDNLSQNNSNEKGT